MNFFFTILFLFCFLQKIFSQDNVVVLHNANTLIGKSINGETVRELNGSVHISQGNTHIKCNKAIEYVAKKKFELEGNVEIKKENLLINCERGKYFTNEKIFEGSQNLKLIENEKILTANYGKYFSNEDKAIFNGNVLFNNNEANLSANEITYFRNEKKIIAKGNIKITSKNGSETAYGNYFESSSEKFSTMKENPKIFKVEKKEFGFDTIFLKAKTIEAIDNKQKILSLKENAEIIFNDSTFSIANNITYFELEDSVVMIDNPIVWYGDTQISGDTIFVKMKENKLSKILVFGKSIIISKEKKIANRFQQIEGKQIEITFSNKHLEKISVNKNVSSYYFIFDEDSLKNKIPNGLNFSTCNLLQMDFKNGELEQITMSGNVEGKYFPENLIENNEENFRLNNFNWKTNHPSKTSFY